MGRSLQGMQMASPIGSLDAYISWTHQVPMLTEEEEHELATDFYENNNLEAARRLVLAHLRFVVSVARGYGGYGLAQADLIQEGNIGLMKAVKRFNPSVGVRLVSFAVHWIKAEMHEFILKNWRIVKIATTKAQRKLFFNLRRATKALRSLSDSEASVVAKELRVDVKDVRGMELRMNMPDQAFDGFPGDAEDNWSAPVNYLEDSNADPAVQLERSDWSDNREQNLQSGMERLDARSQDILQQRWLAEKKMTLHDLAAKYNVSAERIRQLEKNAMTKLKEAIVN